MLLQLFLIAFVVFLALDMLWLGVIAKNFYRGQIGPLMKKDVNWPAAIVFYGLFVFGLVFFVISPAIEFLSWASAFWRGAFFGLIAYATYDLTNLAVLKDWPLKISVVDILWGATLASLVSMITYFSAMALLV
ncbi:MAG: DUF2177 family protein [Candidatus Moraniibacteriota bacterium]